MDATNTGPAAPAFTFERRCDLFFQAARRYAQDAATEARFGDPRTAQIMLRCALDRLTEALAFRKIEGAR